MQECFNTPTSLTTINQGQLTMADSKLAHIEHLSQQVSNRFKSITDIMSQAWIEHELMRESLMNLITLYHEFMKEFNNDIYPHNRSKH